MVLSLVYSYDGSIIVRRSIEIGEPIIYVSMNYRYAVYHQLSLHLLMRVIQTGE